MFMADTTTHVTCFISAAALACFQAHPSCSSANSCSLVAVSLFTDALPS